MKKICIVVITAFIALSCSKPVVNQKNLESALDGLKSYMSGKRVDATALFYPNSVYFNGKPNSGIALMRSLHKDFSDLTDLSVKSEYRSAQDIQKITVLKAVCGDDVSYLVCSWLKIRGEWVIIFMCRADLESAADFSDVLSQYDRVFNRHIVKDLMESFFDDNVCFVKGTNTVFGYDNVAKGYAFLEKNFPYQHESKLLEKYSTGLDYFVLINELREKNGGAKFTVIQIWKATPDGAKIVVTFDYV